MRITHPLTPVEIFTELLRRNALTDADTAGFKAYKHDKDLCPSFTEILEGILGVGTRNSERLDARFMTPFDAH